MGTNREQSFMGTNREKTFMGKIRVRSFMGKNIFIFIKLSRKVDRSSRRWTLALELQKPKPLIDLVNIKRFVCPPHSPWKAKFKSENHYNILVLFLFWFFIDYPLSLNSFEFKLNEGNFKFVIWVLNIILCVLYIFFIFYLYENLRLFRKK